MPVTIHTNMNSVMRVDVLIGPTPLIASLSAQTRLYPGFPQML
jgi:hypothetical protein